jgi:feruloyl esterase
LFCIAVLTGCSTGSGAITQPALQPLNCDKLAGMAIPADAIRLPTKGGTVTEAVVAAAAGTGTAALSEYCKVTAAIAPMDPSAPNIMFRVAMPTSWNNKVVMFGG